MKLEAYAVASVLISIPLAHEPVVGEIPLPRNIEQVWYLSYHSLPSQGFPRYTFINYSKRKDEQQDGLHADCPGQGSNPGLQIYSSVCQGLHRNREIRLLTLFDPRKEKR